MKGKILGLVAAGLSLFALPSHAVTVTLGLNTYTVTTAVGSFDDLFARLSAQPWWGSADLASSAVDQVGQAFGSPNDIGTDDDPLGPFAAYTGTAGSGFQSRALFPSGTNVGRICVSASCTAAEDTFLVVQQTVPEPGTLALLGLCIAGLGLSRRRLAA